MFFLHQVDLFPEEKEEIANDVLSYFDLDDWCKTAPKYQTWPVLFEKKEPHWVKLKNSFESAVTSLFSSEKFHAICWAYVNFPKVEIESYDQRWHHHNYSFKEFSRTMSGVFYISLPEGSNVTEYKVGNHIKDMPANMNCWTIFPGHLMHRPGEWDAKNMRVPRIVLAADFYY